MMSCSPWVLLIVLTPDRRLRLQELVHSDSNSCGHSDATLSLQARVEVLPPDRGRGGCGPFRWRRRSHIRHVTRIRTNFR